jgi:hypothetical protein
LSLDIPSVEEDLYKSTPRLAPSLFHPLHSRKTFVPLLCSHSSQLAMPAILPCSSRLAMPARCAASCRLSFFTPHSPHSYLSSAGVKSIAKYTLCTVASGYSLE